MCHRINSREQRLEADNCYCSFPTPEIQEVFVLILQTTAFAVASLLAAVNWGGC